jgi:hypothetical protein
MSISSKALYSFNVIITVATQLNIKIGNHFEKSTLF